MEIYLLEQFTDSELTAELNRRDAKRKDELKDKTLRTFYRRLPGTFKSIKEKVKAISTLTDERQVPSKK